MDIDIQQNFFNGQIPKFIANLSVELWFIGLANNQLHGAIPIEIEYLTGLEFLILKHNFLSRPIHHINFTRLQRLERLTVEGNKLSGSIPSTIGNLGMLSFLGMSFNNFNGVIPPSLEYLHNGSPSTILHGDLKPSNVLLNDDMVAHVGDFGLAKLSPPFIVGRAALWQLKDLSGMLLQGIWCLFSEYGMGGKVSKEGDVYSYGIILLEMFTGKTPTDPRFTDDLHLHIFVQRALPHEVMEIVDQNILYERKNHAYTGCLLSVLTIGIQCSMTHPEDRMKIKDVLGELLKIEYSYGK
ncbi:hypothetical protein Tsubulata_018209 [Turnera subulata]|uniref:Protein kinase domain-containing protein n=1 Tax=Turnera subulata TaxID=218843 RepID=A0A9Q0F8X4_9ROSI|nr:hypothetical protein Tsubulata_018209 [Turnera subulata]